MDESPVFRGEFAFSYKTAFDHFRDFFAQPTPIVASALAAFGVFWTFGEASIQFTQANPRGLLSYALLLLVSLVASLVWNWFQYVKRTPEGFESEPEAARRIAHMQKPLWEFKLAKTLLAQKLAPLESELRDLIAGRVFVPARKPDTFQAYADWAASQMENLLEMASVATRVLANDFPASLQSTAENPAQPIAILSSVNTIVRLYEATIEFERSNHAVRPSNDLDQLHKLQIGWSDAVRKGVLQLFDFLHQMGDCDVDGDNTISFVIDLDLPPQASAFDDELDRLQHQLPEIARKWNDAV